MIQPGARRPRPAGWLAATAAAVPLLLACAPTAAASAIPGPAGPAPPPYATTRTRVRRGTSTSVTTMFPWHGGPSEITVIEASAATTYEPGPAAPLPATVLETEVHERRLTSLVARPAGVETGSSSAAYTLTRTYLVHRPDPTAHAPGARVLPCGECVARGRGGGGQAGEVDDDDARCKARGLETACQRQCELRAADGNFWCYRLERWEYIYPELRMGRACWGDGGGNEFMQLSEPCRTADYRIGCVPCRGEAINWNGANWIDP